MMFCVDVGRATRKKVEEKDRQVEASPSELTALTHGPGECWRVDGV